MPNTIISFYIYKLIVQYEVESKRRSVRGLGKLCQPGFQAKLCQTNITIELKPNLHVFGSINFDSCLLWHQVKHITWFLLCLWPSQIYHMIVWHVCLICNSHRLGPVLVSDKTSYHKISQSLEAARFVFRFTWLLWNLTGTSAAVLQMCLSNFKAMQ